MSLFQAYCIDKNDDGNFVLTFANSYVADEWWRAISETSAVASFFTRITPQLYTHEANSFNLSAFFTDPRTQSIASKFKGRFFVLDDKNGRGLPIVQNSNVTDVRSGRCYFIRTIANPHLYWHYDPDRSDRYLTVSETPRTRFEITGTNVSVDSVLIGTDEVALQIFSTSVHVNYTSVGSGVYVACAMSNPWKVPLQFLRARYIVPDKYLQYSLSMKSPPRSPTIWELVE